ncbi:initiation factor 2B subunit alpha [Streptomyces abyssalis]|uniref:Methylthioribose-1-phosphate isomerase n=1 Tax=Streptomyces abyssalis TaxID=933944 RepID=A0A1E7JJ67_9ACTN|nr:S-methyl-5-thioribose-1-phosphate isomerase [Streptomyces abyssalis]OEU87150.1 initiation factor 2B subunit alpha [Streptomyces abyssalis]OEU87684.1 initiation factor 2B subunit alpha [Streptomyces abyssalis]
MADHGVPVLRWADSPEGPVLLLLDQARLPAEEAELACRDVQDLVRAIRALSVRGAPLLGVAGGYGVALAAARGHDVAEAADRLASARPTAVNLAAGVRRVERAYQRAVAGEGADGGRAAAAALSEARALHEEDAEASERMAQLGHDLLRKLVPRKPLRLLTHCNTGFLVSGGRGTAFAVVSQVHAAGELRRLWVDETRPLLQGARLTAYEAMREDMPFSVLADGAAGSLFAAGEVDAVLIGADRISADGSVANKVGSYPLAVVARHHGVPFVVVAPVTTVDLATKRGTDIVVEQRAPEEVTHISSPYSPYHPEERGERGGGIPVAPRGADAYNPAFDVTPPELVTAVVTERGVISPVTSETVAGLCSPSRTTTSRWGNGMMNA